jgi:hypothetical protein
MPWHELADLGIRVGGVSLATYAIVGQVIKPTLRMIAKRHASRLTKKQEAFYSWLTRVLSIVVGCLLALLPLWPAFLESSWQPLLGLIAGSLAPGIHRAVAASLPARIKKLLSGGSVSND